MCFSIPTTLRNTRFRVTTTWMDITKKIIQINRCISPVQWYGEQRGTQGSCKYEDWWQTGKNDPTRNEKNGVPKRVPARSTSICTVLVHEEKPEPWCSENKRKHRCQDSEKLQKQMFYLVVSWTWLFWKKLAKDHAAHENGELDWAATFPKCLTNNPQIFTFF